MSDRTEAMIIEVKRKAAARQTEILELIKEMSAKKEKITFYSVAKRTGASKSYLYNNEAIASIIREYRNEPEPKQSPESQSVLIKALKRKIQQLEAEIQKMRKENSDSYKSQCERLKKENQELKVQLQTAYSLYSDKKE